MAISPYKTFVAGEILTASDLNASYSHITTNALALISPIAGALTVSSGGSVTFDTGSTLMISGIAVNPGFNKISSGTVASGTPLIDITGLTTTYRAYVLVFDGLLPATDNVELLMRLSDDGGATYEADASDYAWALQSNPETAIPGADGDADDSEISLGSAFGNAAGEAASGDITIYAPAGSGITQMMWRTSRQSATPNYFAQFGGGQLQTAGATTAFRLIFSAGNFAAMNYTLYGLPA